MRTTIFWILAVWMLAAPSLANEPATLYLPHFTFKNGDWQTDLGLHNPTLNPQTVTVRAYDGQGNPAAPTQLVLPPFGGYNGSITALMPNLDIDAGWLELVADTDRLNGQIQVTATGSGGATTVPLNREAHDNLIFTALKQGDGWASGFAIVNTEDEAAEVVFHLMNWQGRTLATRKETLPARAKWVEMLSSFFGAGDTYPERMVLTVQSSGALTGLALSFKGNSDQIVAVPAQSYEPGAGSETLAAKLNAALADTIHPEFQVHNALVGIESPSMGLRWQGAAGLADPATGETMTTRHPFRLASVGKTMTATLILMLEEEGKLGLEDRAIDHLGADLLAGLHLFEGVDYGGHFTIRQLLKHTSGLGDHLFDADRNGDGQPDLLVHLFTNPEERWDPAKILAYARENTESVAPPGVVHHYSDLGYVLLGLIAERVSGQALHVALRQRIFDPLGMRETWLEYREEPVGSESLSHCFFDDIDYTDFLSPSIDWGGGGEASTLDDVMIFFKALLSGDVFQNSATFQKMLDFVPSDEGQYGLGIEKIDMPGLGTIIGHSGFSGSFMYYWVEADIYLVGTTNQTLFRFESQLAGINWVLRGEWMASDGEPVLQEGMTPVGDVSLQHLSIEGAGPTVVFESGLGGTMQSWSPVLRQIGASAPVFAYNRAGYGQSTFAGGTRDAATIVGELRALLRANGHQPPYILVGHSLGGLYMQYFAKAYPEEVAGLVLVDSSIARQQELACAEFPILCEAMGGGEEEDLPPFVAAEALGIPATGLQVEAAGPFPAVPGAVLTAGKNGIEAFPEVHEWWLRLQTELARSGSFTHVIDPQSGHHLQFDNPQLVIEAIHGVLRSVNR
ncbi:Class A beta-lactamase-related serine hydrolase [Sulfidibacter corallicola]|uniref:Class A beta-lactamase-related serine hydrolase n=1 Tax=Sulfidibacter corallicola TaxID=2818388 RepID=A0A8A4TDH5_SULCO|nr:class A beta-lactamase-related serine hydrolase [Sulfidibacter corallicola]QTD47976.1 class A beta-lactamase-related serine hydrolase [Sulfidibacter corallicola]